MRHVHAHCLESWLAHSKRQHCEARPPAVPERCWLPTCTHTLVTVRGRRAAVTARCTQVCKRPFSFTPVYAPDAPATLPLHELLLGLGRSVLRGCKSAVRVRPLAHERARPAPSQQR